MLTARHAAIRLLKLMMVASIVLPAVLFAFAAWVSYRNFERVSDERIDRSLDILHEHALKVLQTIERTFAEIDEIVRGMSDDDIRLNEAALHARLKRIVDALPQVQGIAIMDRNGHPLVSAQYRAGAEGPRFLRPRLFQGAGERQCRHLCEQRA